MKGVGAEERGSDSLLSREPSVGLERRILGSLPELSATA